MKAKLAPTGRALITRSSCSAYRYGTGDPYYLSVEVTRFPEEKILEAVAEPHPIDHRRDRVGAKC